MTYVLYGNPRSGSLAVELALAEAGARYELRGVDLKAGEQRSPAYAALNPQRKIPALVTPDGAVLTESAAILLALDRLHPEAELMPPPRSPGHAQALRWLMFVAAEIYPIVEINDYPERFSPGSAAGAGAMRELARGVWRRRWSVVVEAISGDPYLLPSGFCLCDIYIAVVSRWAQQDEWRSARIPRVERLAMAVANRSACAPIWTRHYA